MCGLFLIFTRETRSGDAPVMCRMRETDNGSVPAERFGPCMARRVRALLRLQSRAAGQMFLQGGEALLQERLLQVRVRLYVSVCPHADFINAERPLARPPAQPTESVIKEK